MFYSSLYNKVAQVNNNNKKKSISCTQRFTFKKSKGHRLQGTHCMLEDIASIVSVNDTTWYRLQTSATETQPHSHICTECGCGMDGARAFFLFCFVFFHVLYLHSGTWLRITMHKIKSINLITIKYPHGLYFRFWSCAIQQLNTSWATDEIHNHNVELVKGYYRYHITPLIYCMAASHLFHDLA